MSDETKDMAVGACMILLGVFLILDTLYWGLL